MKKTSKTGLYLVLILLCVMGIVAGSFFDLPIAKALYIGDSFPAKVISLSTVILFFESCVFFLGVLFRQLWEKYDRFSRRVLIGVIFSYLFCSTATLGGAKLLNDPLLAECFSNYIGTLWGSLLAGAVLCIAAFLLGFHINGNRYDTDTIKVLTKLIFVFTVGFLLSHYLNCMIDRKSYSMLVTGRNLEAFMPWYRLPKGSKLLMSISDLISSHQGSFVSGHVLYAVSFIIIFPSFSLAFPSLKKYENLLIVLAGILAVTVIICRLLSGNNYLTDISFGALYSLKFCMSFNGIKKTRKSDKTGTRKHLEQ